MQCALQNRGLAVWSLDVADRQLFVELVVQKLSFCSFLRPSRPCISSILKLVPIATILEFE